MSRKVSVYFLDVKLGMTDYEFVGVLPIKEADDLLKCCSSLKKKGEFYKFITENGYEFTGIL